MAIIPPKVIKRDDDIPWNEYHDDDEDPRKENSHAASRVQTL